MDSDWCSDFSPSISKACSRCHARKVKCDLRVPQCSACARHNEPCNITDCVAYPYAAVKRLQDEINNLKARLGDNATRTSGATSDAAASLTRLADDGGNRSAQGYVDYQQQPINAGSRAQEGWSRAGNEAEEVGVLAIGGPGLSSQAKYVGSATGSTFARIFFKQLNLEAPEHPGGHGNSLDRSPSERAAALPPQAIARFLLWRYISRVHTWWPFLRLSEVRRAFQSVYSDPRGSSDADKFVVFAILSLASDECRDDVEYSRLLDFNEPDAYFQTSLRFFVSFHDHKRDLFGIQAVLLLTLWMLNSRLSSHCNDLWHLSRYAMSAAVECGLHRHNSKWGFSGDELEIRNRTWWCIYNLERHIAVVTGRVLSIRDHAIHALQPTQCGMDVLPDSEAAVAPIFDKYSVTPFRLMIRLRRISGRILESIYIAKGADGGALDTPFQQICALSDECRRDLEVWRSDLEAADLKPSREYSELKIEFCLLQLLLNRPSPTFMIPSNLMTAVCSKAASSAVHQWAKIERDYGISSVCRCFRHLHAILTVALAALYCDWQATVSSRSYRRTSDARQVHRHQGDTAVCLDLMSRGIAQIKSPGLSRYHSLLNVIRNKVYYSPGPQREAAASASQRAPAGDFFTPLTVETQDAIPSEGMSLTGASTGELFFAKDDGMEVYLSQVSGLFDGGMLDMDESLHSWYGAIMEELQPT